MVPFTSFVSPSSGPPSAGGNSAFRAFCGETPCSWLLWSNIHESAIALALPVTAGLTGSPLMTDSAACLKLPGWNAVPVATDDQTSPSFTYILPPTTALPEPAVFAGAPPLAFDFSSACFSGDRLSQIDA